VIYLRSVVTFILFYFLTGCSSPTLSVQDNQKIAIEIDQKQISVDAKELKSENLMMSRLKIKRTLYALDNKRQYIVYEEIQVTTPYQFQYDMPRTISILFETNNYSMVDRVGNLSFFVIKMKNEKDLLLIAQNLNKKGIRLIYGLNKEQFRQAMKHVGVKKDIALGQPLLLQSNEKAFLVRWSPKMVITDGLLKRISIKILN
jgi:uncharacterized protein YcfL